MAHQLNVNVSLRRKRLEKDFYGLLGGPRFEMNIFKTEENF